MSSGVSKSAYHHELSGVGAHEGEQAFHNSSGCDGTQDLRDENNEGAEPCQAADEHETEGDGWVEQAAADAEEDPGIDCEREAERKRDIQQLADSWPTGRRATRSIRNILAALALFNGNVGCSKSEEEEHERAKELADELEPGQQ